MRVSLKKRDPPYNPYDWSQVGYYQPVWSPEFVQTSPYTAIYVFPIEYEARSSLEDRFSF